MSITIPLSTGAGDRAAAPGHEGARTPLVSVVVNNYNYARFLPEAIASALDQTYEPIEVVVVDDGSTDDSAGVLHSCAAGDERIVPVFKANGGQASAFNAGVAASRGDIICFLDSDDAWYDGKVRRIVEAHRHHAFVQHNVDKHGQPLFMVPSDRFDDGRLLKTYGHRPLFFPTSALSLTRDLAQQIFPIPEEGLRLCADLFVALSASYLAGVHTLSDSLGMYRIHDANGWQQRPRTANDGPRRYFEILERVNRWLFGRGLYPIPISNEFLFERMMAEAMGIVPNGDYIVYGTGQMSDFVIHLIAIHAGRVKAFVDSSPAKQGTEFRERPVVGPADVHAVASPHDRVVLASMFVDEILETLSRHDVDTRRVFYPPAHLRPHRSNVA